MPRLVDLDRLLNERELAARLHKALDTVRTWRLHGYGPTPTRIGRSVWYEEAEVAKWEREQAARDGA